MALSHYCTVTGFFHRNFAERNAPLLPNFPSLRQEKTCVRQQRFNFRSASVQVGSKIDSL